MEKRLFFLLNMARHKVFQSVDAASEKQLGISVTHVAGLLFIAKSEGCLQKTLAKALGLNKPAVTGLVNRMEALGLIERKPCEQDGRATRLYLKDKGKAILPSVFPHLEAMNQKLAADFSDEELAVVVRFLNSAMQNFE